MKKRISWGMIGCGDVTEKKSAPSFQKIKGSSLAGIMNRTRAKADSYAERHGIQRVFDSAEELIADPGIDAVYVATPPSSHADYAIMAMQAGKPVYVEKPMALFHSECLAMNEASEKNGVPLFVAYYRRSMEYFQKVRDLLAEGAVGRPLLCNSRLFVPPRESDFDHDNLPWRVKPEISGGGYFHDMGCHLLDILLFLFGEFKAAWGLAGNNGGLYEPADTVAASIEFENGLFYSGQWCFVSVKGNDVDEIEITGEKGSIRFSCFKFTPIKLLTGRGTELYSIDPPEHVQLPMIRDVVNELRGEGRSPSTGKSAARVNLLMEKILAGQ